MHEKDNQGVLPSEKLEPGSLKKSHRILKKKNKKQTQKEVIDYQNSCQLVFCQ